MPEIRYIITKKIISETSRRLALSEKLKDIAKDLQIPVRTLDMALRRKTNKTVMDLKTRRRRKNVRRDKAIELVQEGATLTSAAAGVGVSKQMVSIWCKDDGIVLHKSQKSENARQIIRSGKLSVPEIAKKTGFSVQTIYVLQREENIKLPPLPRTPQKHPGHDAGVKDLLSGMSFIDVAKKHGVVLRTAYRWAEKTGIHGKENRSTKPDADVI